MIASGLKKKLETCLTAEACKTSIKQNVDELIKMDHLFFLEAVFLHYHFDDLMEERMFSLMLEVAPALGDRRVLAKAVTAARQLSVGPACTAQKNTQSDTQHAANALLDTSTSSAPTSAELAQMSNWMIL